jgi:hypothetical protein
MSWKDAQLEARRRIAALNLPEGNLDGVTVMIVDYESQEVFDFDGGMGSLKFHQMVIGAMFRFLKKRGAQVERPIVTLNQRVWGKLKLNPQKPSSSA